jgi:triosephosphate isomerase
MNGLAASLDEARRLKSALKESPVRARVAICPPATLIAAAANILAGSAVEVGGQDCRPQAAGAFTGDISAEMLADAGARLVILGHSERRAGYGETDADVAAKTLGALRAGLEPIICVGESRAERDAGLELQVVIGQVTGSTPTELAGRRFAVAYEPIWAIGSGDTPTIADIETVHRAIRTTLEDRFGQHGREAPILYGGSVKPDNAANLLAARHVSGALVGGASLRADEFLAIIRAV